MISRRLLLLSCLFALTALAARAADPAFDEWADEFADDFLAGALDWRCAASLGSRSC